MHFKEPVIGEKPKFLAQEEIYMYHFVFFFMQIDMGTKKQTENLLMLNAIIPKTCKK